MAKRLFLLHKSGASNVISSFGYFVQNSALTHLLMTCLKYNHGEPLEPKFFGFALVKNALWYVERSMSPKPIGRSALQLQQPLLRCRSFVVDQSSHNVNVPVANHCHAVLFCPALKVNASMARQIQVIHVWSIDLENRVNKIHSLQEWQQAAFNYFSRCKVVGRSKTIIGNLIIFSQHKPILSYLLFLF